MIPLMKNTFFDEIESKKMLSKFILTSPKLSMGEQCKNFEIEFSKFQGRKDAILFNSGGSANLALIQSLKNLGLLKEKAKIGFSSLTWSTNVMPIIQLGFTPIAIDCNTATLNIMSDNLKDILTRTSLDALFITNALGFAGDLQKIKEICDENKIILIEDSCEALGTVVSGKKTGNYGLGASFSFFVAHHMSTIEGGMICTDDEELAQMLKIVRANGWDRNLSAQEKKKIRSENHITSEFDAKYTFYDLGFNLRPTEITGFLGLIQLKNVHNNNIKRNQNHFSMIDEIKNNTDLINIEYNHLDFLSPFAFPVVCKNKELKKYYCQEFAGAGIEIRPMIAGNIQKQPFYKKYVDDEFKCPGTDFLDENSFYCGNYPELTLDDIETIKSCLIKN